MTQLPFTDWLTRFIFSRRHCSVENKRVKYGAFLPLLNPETSALEVSVYRISGLTDEQIWIVGDTEVAQPSSRTLYARGDLTVATVERDQLRVAADDLLKLHANIIGWPEEESEKKSIAIELAANALLRVK